MALDLRPRHAAGAVVVGLLVFAVWLALNRDMPISTSGFVPFRLDEIDLSEVIPDPAVDYMELRESSDGRGGERVRAWGTPCSTALRPTACEQELSEVIAAASPSIHRACGICRSFELYATVGDDVVVVRDLDAFLGTVDTPTEAALAAGVGSWVREVDGGFEVVESHYTAECDPIIEVTTLWRILPDGTITELDQHTTSEHGVCI